MFSLIIPFYNEARTIPVLWDRLSKIQWPLPVEFIWVDDGSSDQSLAVARQTVPSGHRVISLGHNQGKTAAIKAGIAAAKGQYIAVQDADLEYDPTDLVRMLRPLMDNQAHVVYGSRFKQTAEQVQRTYHRLGIRLLTAFSNFCTGIYLTDLEGCYKVWRADLLKHIVVETDGFDFDPEVTAKIAKLHVRIHEVHIAYYPRSYREGKKIRFRDGFKAGWTLMKYSWWVPFDRCFLPTLPDEYRWDA